MAPKSTRAGRNGCPTTSEIVLAVLTLTATLAFPCVVRADPSAPAAPAVTPSSPEEESRLQFNRGKGFYAARNFEDALRAFQAAVAAYPSPNAQLLAARCLRELGRLPEAVLAYEDAVVLAGTQAAQRPEYAQARDAAAAELSEVAARVGRVRVDVTAVDGAEVRVNGVLLAASDRTRAWPVNPGTVIVDVTAPSHVPAHQTASVAAGAEVRMTVTLVPESPTAAPSPTITPASPAPRETSQWVDVLAWSSAGVAVLGAGTFVLFYFLADGQQDDYRKACVDQVCTDPQHDRLADRGETYQTLTNVGLVTGLAGLAAATVFFLLGAGDDDGDAATVGVDASGAQVTWRF